MIAFLNRISLPMLVAALTIEVEAKVAQDSLSLLRALSLKAVREQVYSILLLLECTSSAVDAEREGGILVTHYEGQDFNSSTSLMEQGGCCFSDAVEHVQPTKGFRF